MAKGKKNKVHSDFQKVKLKVGRKLKRDCNETKAEFKSRKIILKEIHGHTKDPITALAHHSDHISHHGKLTLLNHFNNALTANIVKSLNKPIIDSLSKFIIDHSEHVRAATYKCVKTCYNYMKQQHLSLREFVYLLKPYLDCAFTHIDRCIADDCLKFLDYLTNTNESQVIEPLIGIVVRRLEAGHPSDKELNLAMKLKALYLKHKKRQIVEDQEKDDRLEPLCWTPRNYILDLDCWIHNMRSNEQEHPNRELDDREVRLVPRVEASNSVTKLLTLVD
jgi:hypothetical protein